MTVKIADFGFSNQFSPGQRLNTWCGSPPYAAPELFQGKEYSGPEVDIWSLGVVLYVVVCGALPFDGTTLTKLRARVLAGKFKIPFYIKRATLEQVKQDKWFVEDYENEVLPTYAPAQLTEAQEEMVMRDLQNIGLDREAVKKSLRDNVYDHLAATYYLLADKHFRKSAENPPPGGAAAAAAAVPAAAGSAAPPPPAAEPGKLQVQNSAPAQQPGASPRARASKTNMIAIDEEGGEARRQDAKQGAQESQAAAAAAATASSANSPGSGQRNAEAAAVLAARATTRRARASTVSTPMGAADRKQDGSAKLPSRALQDQEETMAAVTPAKALGQDVPAAAAAAAVSRAGRAEQAARSGPHADGAKAEEAAAPGSGAAAAAARQVPPQEHGALPSSIRTRSRTVDSAIPRGPVSAPADDRSNDELDQEGILEEEDGEQGGESSAADKIKAKAQKDKEPRSLRFTFSVSTTSAKEPDALQAEVTRALTEVGAQFELTGYLFTATAQDVTFEIEVCKLPRLSMNGLRFKRMNGNSWAYKTLCTDMIAKMQL
ncbi:MAG: hypothetical protein BJ554DRAFT_981 [Olpidium bornovanus]|uniref:non-specific serine/threonine protein kinase n=1 Tax=Olpidium bornovanus TaxID=278681 RepID=A0A8H7ZSK4_9FUNG|nr:MAG: hypothetical protein BJ554DRAFT_981 [Olpidium bornovanus]